MMGVGAGLRAELSEIPAAERGYDGEGKRGYDGEGERGYDGECERGYDDVGRAGAPELEAGTGSVNTS